MPRGWRGGARAARRYGGSALIVRIEGYYYRIQSSQNNRVSQIGQIRYGRGRTSAGTFTVTCDMEARKVAVWRGKKKLGDWPIPGHLTKGKFVVFSCYQSISVKTLNVLKGLSRITKL